MTEHAPDVDRDVEEMEQQSEHVGDLVDEAREDWRRKVDDPQVPGAVGDPDAAQSDDNPETDYPDKGDAQADADRSGADAPPDDATDADEYLT